MLSPSSLRPSKAGIGFSILSTSAGFISAGRVGGCGVCVCVCVVCVCVCVCVVCVCVCVCVCCVCVCVYIRHELTKDTSVNTVNYYLHTL